jgi:polyribonucleotide nucleotidyltransferase
MDFKVAGTHKGITSIQMDLKIDGLTNEIIKEALAVTHKGRDYIIDDIILKAIPAPRADVSEFAPKMITMKIHPDKIREVIGSGGKVIQKIVADTGAKIDIEDDGSVFIAAVNRDSALAAQKIIQGIVFEPEAGAVYTGKVTRVIPIGAFVEFAPGKEGMCHIKDLSNKFVEKVEDVVNEGDNLTVKFLGIDERGRYNLSAKALLPRLEGSEDDRPRTPRPPREDGDSRSGDRRDGNRSGGYNRDGGNRSGGGYNRSGNSGGSSNGGSYNRDRAPRRDNDDRTENYARPARPISEQPSYLVTDIKPEAVPEAPVVETPASDAGEKKKGFHLFGKKDKE